MSGTLFGRITVTGLLAALVVGCGQAEPGGTDDAGPAPENVATVAPNPAAPDLMTPPAVAPNPAPSTPAPSNSVTPKPVPPNVAAPNPAQPNPAPPAADPKGPRVAWVPPGPNPPVRVSGMEAWSAAFRSRDCDAIAELGPKRGQQRLYAGLGDACRAVLNNNENENDRLWTSADAAFERLKNVENSLECLDRLAWGLLRDLVMAHRRAPDADIQIDDPQKGTPWPCGSDDTLPPATSITPTPADQPRPSVPTG